MAPSLPISVVIPHHNRSDLLLAAVASVYAGTSLPAEIIVVDDCSLPEHRERLKELPQEVRVILLEQSRRAPGARNAGIEACTQPWIAFLDDDDEWLPAKLEKQWSVLQADSSLSAVTCALKVVSDNRPPWNLVSHSPEIMTLPAALEDNAAMLQTAVIRASDIRRLGGFDEDFQIAEDTDFWIRFTASGYRAFCLTEALAVLNRRVMNRLSKRSLQMIQARFKLIRKHRSLYLATLGAGAVRRARYKCICRTGLEQGGALGRALYVCGCFYGGDFGRLFKLMFTAKMDIIPYSDLN